MGHFVMCKNNCCRATLRSRGLSIGVAASGGALVELVEASLLEVEERLHLFGVPRVGGLAGAGGGDELLEEGAEGGRQLEVGEEEEGESRKRTHLTTPT